jgi:hypothetical protein
MSVGAGGAGADAGGPPAMPTIDLTITALPTAPTPIDRTTIDPTRFTGRTIGLTHTTGRITAPRSQRTHITPVRITGRIAHGGDGAIGAGGDRTLPLHASAVQTFVGATPRPYESESRRFLRVGVKPAPTRFPTPRRPRGRRVVSSGGTCRQWESIRSAEAPWEQLPSFRSCLP